VLAYARYDGFLGGALVLLEQSRAEHRQLRAALLPLFSTSATRRAHTTLLACTERLVSQLTAKAEAGGSAAPVPLYRLVQRFVLDVTTCCFLGQGWLRSSRDHAEADARRLIALLEEWLDSPPSAAPSAAAAAAAAAEAPPPDKLHRMYTTILDRLCDQQADAEGARSELTAAHAAVAAEEGSALARAPAAAAAETATAAPVAPVEPLPTVLGALTRAGVASDRPSVRAQTAGLLFAGLNSAKELSALLSLLAANPAIQRTARAEVDSVLRGCPPAFDDLTGEAPRLEYCARVVNEALRLAPGIEHLRLTTTRTMRVAAAGVDGSTLLLPRGTRLVISLSALHRHPRHWPVQQHQTSGEEDTPQPELFSPEAQASRPPGCFLPFSAGAKGCPASLFSLHEMRMLLAVVLQRFELTEAAGGGGGVCLVPRL
jgi:cytochrome P450